MSKKQTKTCAYCGKEGFKSQNALNSHIRAKHPNQQMAPPGHPEQPPVQQVTVDIPADLGPGLHPVNCPFCNTPTQVYIKEDGTIGGSSDVPKPPSSSQGSNAMPRRAAHPVVIRERLRQRKREDGTWKNTVAMMGTHGRTAPKMPWYEPGVDERWLLNDSHSIPFVAPHIKEGRVDRWWQMHHRWRFTRRLTRLSDDHWTWLQEVKDVPRIFMQRHYKDVPNSEGFKIKEISEMFIGDKLGRGAGYVQTYYTNTFSYMLAQVAYEKKMGIKDWERIEIYGCELEQLETEYFRQRPGMEWWLGVVAALGIEVYFPHDTFIAYAQDIRPDGRGQRMAQYPGYMAYGYKSPSMKEAEEQKLPIGVDPVEENVIGAWEGYHKWFIHGMNDGIATMMSRHVSPEFKKEVGGLNEWLEKFE